MSNPGMTPTSSTSGFPLRSEETARIHYTPATCSPDDFANSGHSFRHYNEDTEIFIAITMRTEDETTFARTMNSVMQNIAHLCSIDGSQTWGKDSWKKVVVCIISDGRKINPKTLEELGKMRCYQHEVSRDVVDGKAVTAHIFEHTLDCSINDGEALVDVQFSIPIILCLQGRNEKKLNTHRWIFNAFCPLINAKVCILFDVGTTPTKSSIYELWNCFDIHPHVGGACGEIVPVGLMGKLIASVLSAMQSYNMFHKPHEINVSDYVSILPGVFSAYRYSVLADNSNGPGPLAVYFGGETAHQGAPRGKFPRKNTQLAGDRILFLEILRKKGETWALRYVRSAKASISKK